MELTNPTVWHTRGDLSDHAPQCGRKRAIELTNPAVWHTWGDLSDHPALIMASWPDDPKPVIITQSTKYPQLAAGSYALPRILECRPPLARMNQSMSMGPPSRNLMDVMSRRRPFRAHRPLLIQNGECVGRCTWPKCN